jgi:hypothetical protein
MHAVGLAGGDKEEHEAGCELEASPGAVSCS